MEVGAQRVLAGHRSNSLQLQSVTLQLKLAIRVTTATAGYILAGHSTGSPQLGHSYSWLHDSWLEGHHSWVRATDGYSWLEGPELPPC